MSAQPAESIAYDVVAEIAAAAERLDRDSVSARAHVVSLAEAGLAALGAPGNSDGRLPAMAEVIGDVAGVCMSSAFSLWAHRMTIEYLAFAGTTWSTRTAQALSNGTMLGVTAMASAFKEAAGCGRLDLEATPSSDGWVVSGALRWASNLHSDSVMVTAARAADGSRLVIGVPLDSIGVSVGEPFDLLGMASTDSSSVTLTEVRVPTTHVLTNDFDTFVQSARPTFLVLQTAMCIGLADRCVREASAGLRGVNASLADDVHATGSLLDDAGDRLRAAAAAVGGPRQPERRELLGLRLQAADLATTAAGLELRTAGGRGYARSTASSRRFREAAFLPVQSPSETQLRWELSRLDANPTLTDSLSQEIS